MHGGTYLSYEVVLDTINKKYYNGYLLDPK